MVYRRQGEYFSTVQLYDVEFGPRFVSDGSRYSELWVEDEAFKTHETGQ